MAIQRVRRGASGRVRGPAAIPGGSVARMRRPAQPPRAPMPPLRLSVREYDFLVDAVIDRTDLEAAGAEAARCGVSVHDVLLASGRVSQADYAAILGETLGVPVAGWNDAVELDWPRPVPVDGIGFSARVAA